MPVDGIGSGLIIVIAALLWLVYLVPSWLRRREYLATERNALRLQQTLRVMAESAEIPAQVRAEATARDAARQQKVLRAEMHRTETAATARAAARRLAEVQPAIAADVAASSTASRRLRRSRAVTSLVLLAALVTGGVGVAKVLTSGAWMLAAIGTAVAIGSFVMLGQMASVSRTRVELARGLGARPASVIAAVTTVTAQPRQHVVVLPAAETGWTPVPLPKPLHARPQVMRSRELSFDAAAELRQAAADSEARIREAENEPEVTPFRRSAPAVGALSAGAVSAAVGLAPFAARPLLTATPTPAPSLVPSRFASMGFVDDAVSGKTDLDAVFARRRSIAS